MSADPVLAALLVELRAYPGGTAPADLASPIVPMRYRHEGRELAFLSVTSVLGTPLDVTLAELAIETFLPADPATARALTSGHGSRAR